MLTNQKYQTSILKYLFPKPSIKLTYRNIKNMLLQVKDLFETDLHQVVGLLLSDLPAEAQNVIENCIERVDHIGFIVSPEFRSNILDSLISEAGFPDNHQSFPSQILSKELGALVKKKEVPTQIYKAWGQNKKHQNVGIEVFVPSADSSLVHNWIYQGKGAHIALKVKSKTSILRILELLNAYHFEIPEFMNGHPMTNKKEGTIVLYFNVRIHNHPFRIEFFSKM